MKINEDTWQIVIDRYIKKTREKSYKINDFDLRKEIELVFFLGKIDIKPLEKSLIKNKFIDKSHKLNYLMKALKNNLIEWPQKNEKFSWAEESTESLKDVNTHNLLEKNSDSKRIFVGPIHKKGYEAFINHIDANYINKIWLSVYSWADPMPHSIKSNYNNFIEMKHDDNNYVKIDFAKFPDERKIPWNSIEFLVLNQYKSLKNMIPQINGDNFSYNYYINNNWRDIEITQKDSENQLKVMNLRVSGFNVSINLIPTKELIDLFGDDRLKDTFKGMYSFQESWT